MLTGNADGMAKCSDCSCSLSWLYVYVYVCWSMQVEEGESVTIEVHGPHNYHTTAPPRFVKELSDDEVDEGQNVTINCRSPHRASSTGLYWFTAVHLPALHNCCMRHQRSPVLEMIAKLRILSCMSNSLTYRSASLCREVTRCRSWRGKLVDTGVFQCLWQDSDKDYSFSALIHHQTRGPWGQNLELIKLSSVVFISHNLYGCN